MEEALHSELVSIQAKLDTVVELSKRHDHELYGNGREGLVSVVDRLRYRVGTIVWFTTAVVSASLVVAGREVWKLVFAR